MGFQYNQGLGAVGGLGFQGLGLIGFRVLRFWSFEGVKAILRFYYGGLVDAFLPPTTIGKTVPQGFMFLYCVYLGRRDLYKSPWAHGEPHTLLFMRFACLSCKPGAADFNMSGHR